MHPLPWGGFPHQLWSNTQTKRHAVTDRVPRDQIQHIKNSWTLFQYGLGITDHKAVLKLSFDLLQPTHPLETPQTEGKMHVRDALAAR